MAKLEEQEKIDTNPELLLEADEQARHEYEDTINRAYYLGPKFRRDCLHTSTIPVHWQKWSKRDTAHLVSPYLSARSSV